MCFWVVHRCFGCIHASRQRRFSMTFKKLGLSFAVVSLAGFVGFAGNYGCSSDDSPSTGTGGTHTGGAGGSHTGGAAGGSTGGASTGGAAGGSTGGAAGGSTGGAAG